MFSQLFILGSQCYIINIPSKFISLLKSSVKSCNSSRTTHQTMSIVNFLILFTLAGKNIIHLRSSIAHLIWLYKLWNTLVAHTVYAHKWVYFTYDMKWFLHTPVIPKIVLAILQTGLLNPLFDYFVVVKNLPVWCMKAIQTHIGDSPYRRTQTS